MKRQIKFRGKGINKNQWFYGYLIEIIPSENIAITEGLVTFDNPDNCLDYHKIKPETVGEFTGLKDKKGIEIYEGDIVMFRRTEGLVQWGKKKCGFILKLKTGEYIPISNCEKIVGNIYDNPDLLIKK